MNCIGIFELQLLCRIQVYHIVMSSSSDEDINMEGIKESVDNRLLYSDMFKNADVMEKLCLNCRKRTTSKQHSLRDLLRCCTSKQVFVKEALEVVFGRPVNWTDTEEDKPFLCDKCWKNLESLYIEREKYMKEKQAFLHKDSLIFRNRRMAEWSEGKSSEFWQIPSLRYQCRTQSDSEKFYVTADFQNLVYSHLSEILKRQIKVRNDIATRTVTETDKNRGGIKLFSNSKDFLTIMEVEASEIAHHRSRKKRKISSSSDEDLNKLQSAAVSGDWVLSTSGIALVNSHAESYLQLQNSSYNADTCHNVQSFSLHGQDKDKKVRKKNHEINVTDSEHKQPSGYKIDSDFQETEDCHKRNGTQDFSDLKWPKKKKKKKKKKKRKGLVQNVQSQQIQKVQKQSDI